MASMVWSSAMTLSARDRSPVSRAVPAEAMAVSTRRLMATRSSPSAVSSAVKMSRM